MELDISGTGLSYSTGDHIGLWPSNPEHEVERLLQVLDLSQYRDTVILTYQTNQNTCSKISRETVQVLEQFAPSQAAKDLLNRLKEDKEYFHSFVTLRCLKSWPASGDYNCCPWSPLSFSALLDLLPPLQPRYYSISSSNIAHPRRVHVTVAVKKDHFEQGNRHFYGAASNYARALSKANAVGVSVDDDDNIRFDHASLRTLSNHLSCVGTIRQSSFRLPPDPATPIIMVGPGTGVAHFRAFMQERIHIRRSGGKDVVDAMTTIVSKEKGISKGMGEKYMHDLKITGRFHEDIW
ncbi:NADPH-cytochrome P450 reductase [Halenospora varia]|nr:NADPH-cytochrome P450 reductase [Halenospora varia]